MRRKPFLNCLRLAHGILLLALAACTTSQVPTATTDIPAPTLARPTATIAPPTPTPTPQGRTLVVTSPADGGPGTLRQAIQDAQPYDTIRFDPTVFPPDAPVTISIISGLPQITQGNLTIDASNAGVILDGSNITIPEFQHGIIISSDYNIIRGLQIVGFTDAGIALGGGVQYNLIGGDRTVGDGPLGQGNLLSGNNFGVGMWDEETSHNTIQGNYIGITLDGTATWGNLSDGIHSNGPTRNLFIDNVIGGNESAGVYLCCVLDGRNTVTDNMIGISPKGDPLGNGLAGVLIDRSRYNEVGPGNVIAYNKGNGLVFWDTSYNNVTQNVIHENGGRGIVFSIFTSTDLITIQPPLVINFDIKAGIVSGVACANCTVEIFSDISDEGGIYEGRTLAGEDGVFTFAKGTSLAGPSLTTTATDLDGSTSEFSTPTQGTSQNLSLQVGNALPMFILQTKPTNELADNRVGMIFYSSFMWRDLPNLDILAEGIIELGFKRIDTNLSEVEPPIFWEISEDKIPPEFDRFIDVLVENGVTVNYMLHFWDKSGHPGGEGLTRPRFATDEQIQDFMDYVRLVVDHFKGRVDYYTIWSEPDYCGDDQIKCILPQDYINVARQVIPVIRQEDPQAKVVTAPHVLVFAREDFITILRSDVISQFDVIAIKTAPEVTPDNEFFGNHYYEYPSIIQEIKQTASAQGFDGEYWDTDMGWESKETCKPPVCIQPVDHPWELLETDLQAAKYYARRIVMDLGMDVGAGVGSLQWDTPWSMPTVRNLNTIMPGNKPLEIPVEIESDATKLMSFGFSLPNGDRLFAIWNDNVAVDYDPGVPSKLVFPGMSAQKVIEIDVLHGFEQELIIEIENGNLVIRNLLIKDYPIILRLIE